MKILVSWSSGKDSAWMLHTLRAEGIGTAGALLVTINEAAERVAMHAVRTELVRAQAEAAGLPLISVPIPSPCPNEIYEERMAAACRSAVDDGFTHVAFGDLFLEDVRRYREERLAASGLTPLFPLWGRPTAALAREMINGGLEAWLTCVDPRQLPAAFAGRRYDTALLAELPPGVDPCGEQGEFHTCVTAGPMFSTRIDVEPGITVERDGFVLRTWCTFGSRIDLERSMTRGRLEAFSDGVIAILITIMVLELKVPHGADWEALRPKAPVFLTYVLSFVFLAIYWNNHHHMLHAADRINGRILWANTHLLFWLSLVPSATGWMGENHLAPLPTAVYGVVLLASALAYTILQNTLVAHQGPHSKLGEAVGSDLKGKLSLLSYMLAIPLAFVHTGISAVLYVFVALMWLVPDRRIESRLNH